MANTPEFSQSLLARVRKGDPQAAEELVRQYEPLVRARVRVWLRLNHPQLVPHVDSADICQSVLGSFFARYAGGQFDVDGPEQLAGLLVRMARHKLLDQAKRRHARSRDPRRERRLDGQPIELTSADPGPAREIAGRELLDEIRRRLDPEERRLADLRGEGCTWAEAADRMGGTPEARRKQLARALDRIARDLGLDDADFESD